MKKCLQLFAALTVLSLGIANADEFRGLWVDAFGPGFFNAQEVSNLVSDCRKYNFNAVMVEMRPRGDAFYMPHKGNGDVRKAGLDPNYDALTEIIKQCHEGTPRIEVHCWVTAQFIWANTTNTPPAGHVFNLHPEYLTKDSVGQTFIEKGWFLDPGNPDACQWNHDVAVDIVKHYDLDGFHWDYLRYPNQDSGYNEAALARYNAEFGLKGNPLPTDPNFGAWRRRQVTDFLRWVDADILEIRPKLVISASVFANYQDAVDFRFQDWVKWNEEGILDVTVPMDFSTNNQHIFNPRADFAFAHQGIRRIYLGQGAYFNKKANTVKQLNYVRQKGFEGFCIYSYRHPNSGTNYSGTLEYFKEHFHPTWTSAPTLPWKANPTNAIIKGTIISKTTGLPLYNAEIILDGTKTQRTEAHGKFAFFEVPPGEHLLVTKSTGTTAATNRVNIPVGQVLTLQIQSSN